MAGLIWGGAVVSVLGMAGIFWCIWVVWSAKRAGLEDESLKARVQKVLPVNLGALLLSAVGLGMVTVGVILG